MAIKRLDHVNFVTHDMPATIAFYCNVIGLVQGANPDTDIAKSVFLYIKDQNIPIVHIGNAKNEKKRPKFERFSELSENNKGDFSTGSFDHFCLQFDGNDYEPMIAKLNQISIKYQTYCHEDMPLKQIWMLDPNGVRVELNFS